MKAPIMIEIYWWKSNATISLNFEKVIAGSDEISSLYVHPSLMHAITHLGWYFKSFEASFEVNLTTQKW